MMAEANSMSSLDVEKNLKEELAVSQQKLDRYAHLIATLSDELDTLRNKICPSCKKKLLSTNDQAPTQGPSKSPSTVTGLPSLWRRAFQGRQQLHPSPDNPLRRSPYNPSAAPQNNNTTSELPVSAPVPSEPAVVARTSGPSKSTPGSDKESMISSEPKPEPPTWSVEYHPGSQRVLDLHLANVVTYKAIPYCVKISPDGHRVAVGLHDGTTYLNELNTGSKICTFVNRYEMDGYRDGIFCLEFSPNGQLLATGTYSGKIRIWDIAQKRTRAIFNAHTNTIKGIVFFPNGRSFISGSDDASVRIWSLRDGSSKVLPVTGRTSYFFSVALSPDGRYIAGGNLNNSLYIWDSRRHKIVAKWWGHTSSVRCIEFTPDGKGLVSGSGDRSVRCWDMTSLGTGSEVQSFPEIRKFLGHTSSVRSVVLFPGNSQWIATSSDDQTVRVWDIESGVCYLTLHGHTDWVRGADVGQNFLVAASDDRRVTFWKFKAL